MSDKIFWIRYRNRWSHGVENWIYMHLYFSDKASKESELEEFAHEQSEQNQWSEHYRGCDAEIVDNVPAEILEQSIKSAQDRVKSAERVLTGLQEYQMLHKS